MDSAGCFTLLTFDGLRSGAYGSFSYGISGDVIIEDSEGGWERRGG